MDDLLQKLEMLKIKADFCEDDSWIPCIELIQRSFVPQKTVGAGRPCEEKDFKEYKLVVDGNLCNIRSMLQYILNNCREKHPQLNNATGVVKIFNMNLILLIGEHHEKNIWNTAECVLISKELLSAFCNLYAYQNISQFLMEHENFNDLLLMLRPKLLKDTWKTYPSAVACYKWILQKAEKPILVNHIKDILPIALIIIDDDIPNNVVIGLRCMYQIIQHSHMNNAFMDSGYAKVIYHTLQSLTYQNEIIYIIPLYTCIANLLTTIEYWDFSMDHLNKWTARDDILSILICNMEFEQNVELRHAYMSSLYQLLTNTCSARWCEIIIHVLCEYCKHHTDLRTLRVTLETARRFIALFGLRVVLYCNNLHDALLKLHSDLMETPVFDRVIIQNLDDCLSLLYEFSPDIRCALMNDDRVCWIRNNSSRIAYQDDITYFE